MVTDVPGRFDAKCRAVREHPRLNFPDENAPAPKRVEHAPTSSKYRGVKIPASSDRRCEEIRPRRTW